MHVGYETANRPGLLVSSDKLTLLFPNSDRIARGERVRNSAGWGKGDRREQRRREGEIEGGGRVKREGGEKQ